MSLKERIVLLKLLNKLDKEVCHLLTSDDLHELGTATSMARSIITIESYLRRELP